MKIHVLKIWPNSYSDILTGRKSFEVRVNDRDYMAGDLLVLREWDPAGNYYTGKAMLRGVKYIMQGEFGLPEDLCVMGLYETEDPSNLKSEI